MRYTLPATPEAWKSHRDRKLTEIAPNPDRTFKVLPRDEAGVIGEGTHQRAIVAKERFEQKAGEASCQK